MKFFLEDNNFTHARSCETSDLFRTMSPWLRSFPQIFISSSVKNIWCLFWGLRRDEIENNVKMWTLRNWKLSETTAALSGGRTPHHNCLANLLFATDEYKISSWWNYCHRQSAEKRKRSHPFSPPCPQNTSQAEEKKTDRAISPISWCCLKWFVRSS